jgi:uncharacterized protein (DUF58 family)
MVFRGLRRIVPWRRTDRIDPPAPTPVERASDPPPDLSRPRELPAQLLRRLEFTVLRRLDGFVLGDYSGRFYGPSLDLAEVREYQPGDEVRRIDWNVTARTGTVHVRQYREEREILAFLIADLTPSMAFGTRRQLKRDAAIEFAGLAAAVATRRGDKIGALGFARDGGALTPLAGGRRQALTILGDLMALRDGRHRGATHRFDDLAGVLGHAERVLRRRMLIFVISDFLPAGSADNEAPWARPLGRLAQRHDVVAVRVGDPAEFELPDAGDLRLRDPESGEEVWVDSGDPRVRRAHAALVAERERALARSLRAARVDRLELTTARDPVDALLRFGRRRRGLRR